jgi:hypothetical protein
LLTDLQEWLYRWLLMRESDVLPRLIDIARDAPEFRSCRTATPYELWSALHRLSKSGRILWRCGTRSENRGHQAIRIRETGRVLKTAGCPFDRFH